MMDSEGIQTQVNSDKRPASARVKQLIRHRRYYANYAHRYANVDDSARMWATRQQHKG